MPKPSLKENVYIYVHDFIEADARCLLWLEGSPQSAQILPLHKVKDVLIDSVDRKITVFFSGQTTPGKRFRVPTKAASQIDAKNILWMMEEDLSVQLDTTHLAHFRHPNSEEDEAVFLVLVAEHQSMRQWIETLGSQQIHPLKLVPVHALLPDNSTGVIARIENLITYSDHNSCGVFSADSPAGVELLESGICDVEFDIQNLLTEPTTEAQAEELSAPESSEQETPTQEGSALEAPTQEGSALEAPTQEGSALEAPTQEGLSEQEASTSSARAAAIVPGETQASAEVSMLDPTPVDTSAEEETSSTDQSGIDEAGAKLEGDAQSEAEVEQGSDMGQIIGLDDMPPDDPRILQQSQLCRWFERRNQDLNSINLLVGRYIPDSQLVSEKKLIHLAIWSTGLSALVACAYFVVVGTLFYLDGNTLEQKTRQRFSQLFPQVQEIRDIRRQTAGLLRSSRSGSGLSFAPLIELIEKSLLQSNVNYDVFRLRYKREDSRLLLSLYTDTIASANIINGIFGKNGFDAKLLSADSDSTKIVAIYSISTTSRSSF